jgi:acyl dehydratase
MNLEPMHFNEAYAAETEFGERLVNGFVVVAVAVGMSVIGAQPGGSS